MNNKRSSIEFFIEQLEEKGKAYEETIGVRTVNICIDVSDYMELKQQAKAMHKEEVEQFTSQCVIEHLKGNPKLINEYYNETFGE